MQQKAAVAKNTRASHAGKHTHCPKSAFDLLAALSCLMLDTPGPGAAREGPEAAREGPGSAREGPGAAREGPGAARAGPGAGEYSHGAVTASELCCISGLSEAMRMLL